jgi:PAS domain S-box-containing protein
VEDDVLTKADGSSRDSPGNDSHFIRTAEVADFLDSALRSGGAAIAIATAARLDELRHCLAGLGSSPGQPAWYPGQLILLDAGQTLAQFMVDGWPDPQRFGAALGGVMAPACGGGRMLHASSEMAALLYAEGQYAAAKRVEQLWNELAGELGFSLFTAPAPPAATPAARADSRLDMLEQKVLALEAEVARRKAAEHTLRRREKELADFVENAAEGLHRVGADGTILWANAAELRMLGYRWEEYVGRHIGEFHVDAPVIARILQQLQAGDTLYDVPARLRCKDGSIKHVLIQSNACFENGELRYTRCFMRDATERHERDQALIQGEQLLAELSAANSAKDEFLAMLGHELRNPLSPIVTALQLMRMRGDTGALRERQIIERQVGHLVRLVEDLLDVSRVTRGNITLQPEQVDIAQPLAKAVEMASLLLDQRKHALMVEVAPELHWHGDPARLAQVVANLLTNAARYTDPGGEIVLRAWREAPGSLVISVKDSGTGLAPETLAQVFDLFFQGKRGLDRTEGGLGVGLALVKSIVELHGGTVEANSQGRGRGSEFVVRLPAGLEPAQAVQAPAPVPAAAAPLTRRVMIVDDNADGAEMLGRLLAEHGHEVAVFNDPLLALADAQRLRPHVAVLDIGLPGMDGYELAARLRAQLGEHGCRLVALSGYSQAADKTRSAEAGFEQHLVKPVSPDQIVGVISRA